MNAAATTVATALLLLSPCLWMPLGLGLIDAHGDRERRLRRLARRLHAPAAALLVAAFLLPTGTAAALLCAPWLAVTALLAAAGLLHLRSARAAWSAALGESAALGYPLIGAAWALAARADAVPLGFSAAIALLTAAHFHHAGFTLPLATARLARHRPGRATGAAVWLVVAGMPVTAAGITATQLGASPWIERLCAGATALAALFAALLLLRAAADAARPAALPPRARTLLSIAGAALAVGMTLALLYAARHAFAPVFGGDEARALDWMVYSHAVTNGVLFAGGAVLGWRAAAGGTLSRR
ncbi:MAG: YndJ family transporter [Planctomycetota bacterium]